jgi:hypothetical protein
MPVPLEKTIELRELVLSYVANSKVIDDVTRRRVQVELEKIPNHENRLMLKALLSVAKNDAVSAIHNFDEYVRRYPSVFSYSDYITYLATTAKMGLAYEQSIIAYKKFGRKYGREILMKMLNIFKYMFDVKMVNAVFDDLKSIGSDIPVEVLQDIEGFNENYREFIDITGDKEETIRNVISVACKIVASKCDFDSRYQLDQILFSKNEFEKECGVTIYVSHASACVASDMNFELLDLLAANDAFPNGSWALWFEPARVNAV